jgi:hypothetical protein
MRSGAVRSGGQLAAIPTMIITAKAATKTIQGFFLINSTVRAPHIRQGGYLAAPQKLRQFNIFCGTYKNLL